MPMHHATPDGPLPPDVKKNLTAVGFSDEAIDDLFQEVRQAHQQLEQIEKEKAAPTINPNTPLHSIPMNDDHDLFEESPDSTPEPTPGPATPGLGSDDDDENKKKATASPSKLPGLQQKHLADQRRALLVHAKAELDLQIECHRKSNEARALTASVLADVVNKTHSGSWDELWPLVESLSLLRNDGYPYVFVLSGWCASKIDLAGPPVPPQRRLLEKLREYGIYGRAAALAATYVAAPTEINRDWLGSWVRARSSYFKDAIINDSWTVERITKVTDAELAKQTLDLKSEFLFLEHRVFWFTPAPPSLTNAWADFYFFALGYHHMPAEFKNDLGPYALTIRVMP